MLSRKSPMFSQSPSHSYTQHPLTFYFVTIKKLGAERLTNLPQVTGSLARTYTPGEQTEPTGRQLRFTGHKNHILVFQLPFWTRSFTPKPHYHRVATSLPRRLFEGAEFNKLFLHPNRFAQPSPSNRWEEVEAGNQDLQTQPTQNRVQLALPHVSPPRVFDWFPLGM